MKTNIFLAVLPTYDNRTVLSQKVHSCEVKRSPLVHVQWTHLQDMHITIGYIENVDENDVRKVMAGFTPISKTSPFMAHVAEVKLYGNALVLRMEPYPIFKSMNKKMNEKLQEVSNQAYHFESRKRFDPHLTIGRIRNINDLNMLHKQQFLSLVEDQFRAYSMMIQQAALLWRKPETSAVPAYQTLQLYTLTGL